MLAAATRKARDFLNDQTATTAIEYGLVAGGIAVAIATTVHILGNTVMTQLYNKIANALS